MTADVRAAMSPEDDLVSEVIAQVARELGIVLTRDDPLIALIFLNRAILQRYLDQALEPVVTAIEAVVTSARTELTESAQTQAAYVDRVMFKDRETFVEQQKALLAEMDERLASRDAEFVNMLLASATDARERLEQVAREKHEQQTNRRPRRLSAEWIFALGAALGAAAAIGGAWILSLLTVGGQ